jgi:hypothetical protein
LNLVYEYACISTTKLVQVYKRKIPIKFFLGCNLLERNGGIQINAKVLPEIFPFYLFIYFCCNNMIISIRDIG